MFIYCSGVVLSQKVGSSEENTTPTMLATIANIYVCSILYRFMTILGL